MSLATEKNGLGEGEQALNAVLGDEVAPEAVAQLQEAFRVFNEASSSFAEHYARLEQRIADLNLELEEANERLRQNLAEKEKMQDYLSALLESLPVGVVGAGPDGRVHSLNRQALEILDTREERVPSVVRLSDIFPENALPNRDDARTLRSVELAIAKGEGGFSACEVAFQPGEGRRNRILRLQVIPIGDNAGTSANHGEATAVLLVEDVTDIRRLEQQATRNDRLTAMGEIAMNVAHEIRNPLGSIELFASMLQRDLSGQPEKAGLAAHISTGVRCLDHIVSNILQFSRPQRLSCTSFDLNELLEETVLFAEHILRQKQITVQQNSTKPRVPMWADQELLKQMFLNILLNAVQATPEQGGIELKTLPNGKTVEIQIRDTGPGFSAEALERIFDPFFTTRRKGTGLGLTIVHNIVTSHQGSIDAENHPEGGALFSIVLPKRVPSALDGTEIASPLHHVETSNENSVETERQPA